MQIVQSQDYQGLKIMQSRPFDKEHLIVSV